MIANSQTQKTLKRYVLGFRLLLMAKWYALLVTHHVEKVFYYTATQGVEKLL
jgi:hypothetical protein